MMIGIYCDTVIHAGGYYIAVGASWEKDTVIQGLATFPLLCHKANLTHFYKKQFSYIPRLIDKARVKLHLHYNSSCLPVLGRQPTPHSTYFLY